MKLKDLLNENILGALPSSKLMKMKWNPVTEGNDDLPMDKMDSAEMEPFREASGDNTQYSWGQINKALMSYGMSPAKILRVLSVLKQQTKNR